ncbi:MAG TPA: 3-oxoacyl-[acyl-carrier-protein] reductase [Bacteroidales bacterium]|nr:3-oxoacyl-[acyl-carrier-protein] reductase [Bacteroidales bacterium]HRZ49882.1 3-oxoacyl-[acyl-carrier-protein] reductase [Bacteroidales bacterium]
MKLLEGKTALVTGGARGIGKAIALKLAGQGCSIAFSDIRIDDHAQALVEEIKQLGVNAVAFESDASDFAACEKLANDTVEKMGRIDILVNNAGITRDNLLMRMSEEEWDMVIRVNLKSVFNLTKAVQKFMLKQRSGSIINMTSVVGVNGNAGQSNYAASKAGMIGFTKSIAKELGSRNVRCNAVAPGFIETEMTSKLPDDVKKEWAEKIPLRRAGQPSDVADICLFLASDLSSYVTGQIISVCGGMNI